MLVCNLKEKLNCELFINITFSSDKNKINQLLYERTAVNMKIMWKILIFLNIFTYSYTLPINLLYKHSSAIQLPKEDDVSDKVILTVPVVFYGERYKTLYVSFEISLFIYA